jgi:hypothetical protein
MAMQMIAALQSAVSQQFAAQHHGKDSQEKLIYWASGSTNTRASNTGAAWPKA